MDLASEKLQLVEQLVQVDDVHLLEEIKQLLKDREAVEYKPDGTPIIHKDVINRAEDSDKAMKQGDVVNLKDLEEDPNKLIA